MIIVLRVKLSAQVEVSSKQIKGVEALLRWQCQELGKVSPVEFIPILEESGLIIPVGLWVIKKAIQACSKVGRI